MAVRTYDEVYFFNFDSYEDLRLYEVGCQKCDPSYGYGPIIRDLYILHYIYEGSGKLYMNDQVYPVSAEQAFIIPAGTLGYYEADDKTPWNYIWIQFDGFKIKEMLNRCGLSETNPVLSLREHAPKTERCLQNILTNHEDEYACHAGLERRP